MKPMRTATCSIPDCGLRHHARGWCRKHYRRWQSNGDPLVAKVVRGDNVARLLRHIDSSAGPGNCWPWLSCVDASGYGLFRLNGRQVGAHRVTYELLVGPIPEGLQIDHLCRNRLCVNPDHLEPVTSRENTLRGEGVSARHARQTHCVNGHEFTPENTYLHPRRSGRAGRVSRGCRTCARASGPT